MSMDISYAESLINENYVPTTDIELHIGSTERRRSFFVSTTTVWNYLSPISMLIVGQPVAG